MNDYVLRTDAPLRARVSYSLSVPDVPYIAPAVFGFVGFVGFACALGSGVIAGSYYNHWSDVLLGIILCSVFFTFMALGAGQMYLVHKYTFEPAYGQRRELHRIVRAYNRMDATTQESVNPLVEQIFYWAEVYKEEDEVKHYTRALNEFERRVGKFWAVHKAFCRLTGDAEQDESDIKMADSLIVGMEELRKQLRNHGFKELD